MMAKTINQFQRESRMDCYAENEQLRADIAKERNKLEMAEAIIAGFDALITGLANDLAAAQAVIEQMHDLLDDCVNSLANYKLLQRRSNDPIGAEVTAKEISSIKSVLALTPNLNALHEALAKECERLAKKRRLLGDSSTALLLDIEAAAHRARKEGK